MKTLTAAKIAATLAYRILQGAVIGPSLMIAALVASLAITGQHPADFILRGMYEWADTAVRAAPPNSIWVRQCSDAPPQADIKPPVLCESQTKTTMPADEAIAKARGQLEKLYFLMSAISAGLLPILYPGRRFFGLPKPDAQPAAGYQGVKE